MNVKRFVARTSRDALNLLRQALGDDAVVLSTKPCTEGVEVLAMAPEMSPLQAKLAARMSSPATPARREPPVLREEPDTIAPSLADAAPDALRSRRDQQDMMNELRSMKGLIEERFGALAFMEKLQ